MLTPYQDSGGEYGLGINTVAGYLMALHSECPRAAREDGGGLAPWKPLPDLQHWADVAFIAYKEQYKLDGVLVTGLRYVFRCEIKNEETLKVIRAICDRVPGLPPTMNTMTFDASSAQGKALRYTERRRSRLDASEAQATPWEDVDQASDSYGQSRASERYTTEI